ncbi:MAG: type IV pilus assembly protein PilM [Candidatus Paceibacterota bacterium]
MPNILDSLKNIFQNDQNKSVLGIDVGPSSIKIVQLKKRKGRAILETYGELSLGPYAGVEIGRSTNLPTEKIAEAVIDVLRESNTTTNRCGISIPMGSSLVSFIKLPKVEEKQLAQMIPLEARKYIPVPISEVSLDYLVIPQNESTVSEYQTSTQKPEEKTIDVLLVVIHNDAMEKNREITRLAKLDTAFSEIEIFGSMRSVLEPGTAPQMIIDFGSNSTKIYIIERGILRTSHMISRGSQDITLAISKSLGISVDDAEKMKRDRGLLKKSTDQMDINEITSLTLDYIFSEIGRVLLSYQKKTERNVSKVFLTGGGVLLKGLKEKAESSFNVPVAMADPFSKVEFPAFLESVLKQAGPSFAVAIGLALRRLQEVN